MEAAEESFRRGQVEWALWRAFVGYRSGPEKDKVPEVFRTRIKRLLEIDRSGDLYLVDVPPPSPFAFSERAAEGTGNDVLFTILDVFCLAVAVELLDAGFKQKEVVFLLRHLRPELSVWLPHLLSLRAGGRQRIQPKDRPESPFFAIDGREPFADITVFLIVRKVELTELFPQPLPKDGFPSFLPPLFCEGLADLTETLARNMPLKFRKAMIIELAQLGDLVRRFLSAAPERRRGRPGRGTNPY